MTSSPFTRRNSLAGLTLFALASATAAAERPAPTAPTAPGVQPVFVPERSGRTHRTWDLGPSATEPGRRNYRVEITAGGGSPATIALPPVLGAAPLRITLEDGRRIEWTFAESLPLREAPAAAANAGPDDPPVAASPLRPGAGAAARLQAGGFELALPARELHGRLVLDSGLRVALAPRESVVQALRVVDARGEAVFSIELGGARATVSGADHDGYELILSPAPGADAITAYGSSVAGYGGYQCQRGNAPLTGTGGNDNTGLYNRNVYVGEYTNISYPRYTCNGYLRFDTGAGALPETGRAYWAGLAPLRMSSNTGSATKIIHFTDIDNDQPLPFLPTGAYFDATLGLWNDFSSMTGGRQDYGRLSISSAVTVPATLSADLNGAAIADLNGRVRARGFFAVGFTAEALAQGNYVIFEANNGAGANTVLSIEYTDYAPKGVTFNRYYNNLTVDDQVAIHNYGEPVSLNGWRIRSVDTFGVTRDYAFPNLTLDRHQSLNIVAESGVNTAGTLYTNNTYSFYGYDTFSSTIHLSLCKGDCAIAGNGVDYLCVGAGPAAPSSGAGWGGACAPGFAQYRSEKVRVDDTDSDSAADFTEVYHPAGTAYPPFPPLPPALKGTARRSEVVFNRVLIYSGYDWFQIANYGRSLDLQGWMVDIYNRTGALAGTYAFDADSVVNPGEIVWLSEPTGVFTTLGRLAKNTGVDSFWEGNTVTPAGGALVLRDRGGQVRDSVLFGAPGALPAHPDLFWAGPPVRTSANDYWELRRTADGGSQSAANWIDISYPGSTGWNTWTAGQRGAAFHEDRIGTGQSTAAGSIGYYNDRGAPGGGGNVITVTRTVGLEEAFFEVIPLSVPAPAKFVVKKQGSGALHREVALPDITAWGRSIVSTGKLSPPVILEPGTYAIMLYVNGLWYDAELSNPSQKLSFGTIAGVTYENNWTPTTAFAANFPGWGLHAGLGTLDPPAITSPAALPAGERAFAYPAQAHTATGGWNGAYSWSITGGALPAGLTLSAAGSLSGTPSVEGQFTFTVRVTDGAGLWSEQVETLFVYPPLEVGTSRVPDYSTASEPYGHPLAAYGGVPPYVWGCTGLPAGLSCTGGSLAGTLNAGVGNGAYPFNAQVTDALGAVASRGLSLTVYRTPQIITPALSDGAVGRLYGALMLQAVGGQGTVTWSVTVGALPPGLALNAATGAITGTPTLKGLFALTIQYATSLGGNATRAYTLNITDNSGPGHWIRKGLAGGSVAPVFSPNFALDKTVIGENSGTLYISRDGGYYWKPLGFSARPVTVADYSWDNDLTGLAFSPDFNAVAPASGSNKTIFIGSQHSGVWYTDNLGAGWSQLNTGLGSYDDPTLHYATDLFVAPDYPVSRRVYCRSYIAAGDYYAVFSGVVNTVAKTISWTRVSPAWLKIGSSSYNLGLALHWSPTFAADQTLFAKIYADGVGYQIYRSTDAAVSWTKVHDVPAGKSVYYLEISPRYSSDGTLAYADGLFNGVVRLSTDGGKSFTPLASQWPMFKLAFPPDYHAATNPVLFATSYNTGTGTVSLARSADNGRTWTIRNTLGTGVLWPFFSPNFGSGPGNDQLIIGAFFNGTLSRSEDGGISGTPSDGGLFIRDISAVAFAPNYLVSKKVFVAIGNQIYYSANGGKAWKKSITPEDKSIYSLRVSPAFGTDQRVFAYACSSYDNCTLWRSTNGGLNFSAFGPTLYQLQDPDDFRISPNFLNDQMLFVTNYPFNNGTTGFYRSSDGGATFQAQGAESYIDNVDNFGISPGFASDATIYANDWSGAGPNFANTRISVNGNNPDGSGGLSWSDFATGPDAPKGIPPAFPPEYNRASGVDGTASHTFFWNCRKTTNGGVSWTASPGSGPGCGGGWGGLVFVSPTYATDATLYSMVREADVNNPAPGLFRSTNGGASFTAMTVAGNPAAFDNLEYVAISPTHASDGLVFAATTAGLYRTNDWGATWQLTTGSDPISPDVSAATADPNQPGGVYMGTQSGEVFASTDDGITAENITANLPAGTVTGLAAVGSPTALVLTNGSGLYRRTDLTSSGTWSLLVAGNFASLRQGQVGASPALIAANRAGTSRYSTTNGASWSPFGAGANAVADIASASGAGFAAGKGEAPAGSSAALWSASSAGARYSSDNGANWFTAPGGNDYTLPALAGAGAWTVVQPLASGPSGRTVLIGNNGLDATPSRNGVWLSTDGGDTWRNVSGAGSGLEATTKNVSAFLATNSGYGTDLLVGITGATTGGVFLSSDGGAHWTQVNQGFDPANLSISTLARTSCATCPVQYYSGSYGGGLYTRTIAVVPPPALAVNYACWGSTGCACGATPGSGPVNGGQPFRLCGSNFQTGVTVEFDGIAATGCTRVDAGTLTCTATPPHVAGYASVRVRNPDTRTGALPAQYQFTGGTSRTANTLRIAKNGANANLTWTCTGCSAGNPGRLYRAQNAAFSLFQEQYNVGTGSAYTNTGAVASGQSYFWSVE